jgi:hypothetical protein
VRIGVVRLEKDEAPAGVTLFWWKSVTPTEAIDHGHSQWATSTCLEAQDPERSTGSIPYGSRASLEFASHLVAAAGAKSAPELQVDVFADRADRAVHEHRLDDPFMEAA